MDRLEQCRDRRSGMRTTLTRCAGGAAAVLLALAASQAAFAVQGGKPSEPEPPTKPVKPVSPPPQPTTTDCTQLTYVEQLGTLPDGTPWGMRKPSNWNGVLINDLDFIPALNNPRTCYWLSKGYAVSGTNRHPQRAFQYDPAQETTNLMTVIDNFATAHGQPNRIVEYGHSGGGFVALGIAENYSNRIDGVVAGCAHEQVPLMNTMYDGWFVLQSLIAPHLQIANFTDLAAIPALGQAWRAALTEAQATPAGRARIALAVAIGQWPAWTSLTKPPPNERDVVALQEAMFDTAITVAAQPGGQSRFMSEHAGGVPPAMPRQLSWNNTVDYERLFHRADKNYARAVRALYKAAGVDLQTELAVLNSKPRISADPAAIAFWAAPGRTVHGTPKIPVLRFHTTGDHAVPPQIMDGYEQKMRQNHGDKRLYRTVVVEAGGHCTFSASESAAAIETLLKRVETGRWPDTQPRDMNKLANKLLPEIPARFVDYDMVKYNRPHNAPASYND
jgi:pimeloyl-ACP methyl ester carboxylesterase